MFGNDAYLFVSLRCWGDLDSDIGYSRLSPPRLAAKHQAYTVEEALLFLGLIHGQVKDDAVPFFLPSFEVNPPLAHSDHSSVRWHKRQSDIQCVGS